MPDGILSDLTVLDISENLPGPFFTQSLVDLGARVIKIERPTGDSARASSPGLFQAVNRGKESIRLDLKDDPHRESLTALLQNADVLVDGFRPGVLNRLGLDPTGLRKKYPRLIVVSIVGYNLESKLVMEPGHDITYAAYSGVLSIAGPDPTKPVWAPGIPVGDLAASSTALASTLAAVYSRERTGVGCRIVVPIADALAYLLNPRLGVYHANGLVEVGAMRNASQSLPAYGVFLCRDGQPIALGALEDHFWKALVHELDITTSVQDGWMKYEGRRDDHEAVNNTLAKAIADRKSEELLICLQGADVPCAPILSPFEALNAFNVATGAEPEQKYFPFPATFVDDV